MIHATAMTAVPPPEPVARAATPTQVQAYVRAQLAGFLGAEVNPGAADRDERGVPLGSEAFRRPAELGLLGFLLPRQVGGVGGDRWTFGLLLEQLGYFAEELEYASLLSMYADIPAVIAATGRPELVERYVLPMRAGRLFGTFAYTERTDAFDFRCRAVRHGDGYLLDGEKSLQTGGHLAKVFLTYVRGESDDIQLFLVRRTDPGVRVAPVATTGFRAAGLTRLTLDQVRLEPSRLLVPVDGLSHAQRFLNDRRLFVVCPMVGRMKAIVESCAAHLAGVVRYGQPLTSQQAVQATLGRMLIRYEAARAVLHDALASQDGPSQDEPGRDGTGRDGASQRHGARNEQFDALTSAAKYTVVENAIAVAMDAIKLTGWQGYSRELPYERYLRAFLGGVAGQTAQDVIELLLGNEVVARAELAQHAELARRAGLPSGEERVGQ